MSITCVLIDKHGSCSTKQFRNVSSENLYKKCGFSSNDNFGLIHTFKTIDNYIHLFGKSENRSNNINKVELPPPIDKNLYYGSILIIETTNKIFDLNNSLKYTKDKWKADYSFLMGGFEDIEDTDDEIESDEMDKYDESQKTKTGYLKDGFVVDEGSLLLCEDSDNESEYNESEYNGSELEEELYSDESE
jgi:hypothetical protein